MSTSQQSSVQASKHRIAKSRRQYNTWVATESLEDYALRYSPSSFRKWSPLLLANTALGGISFLALEAIGAVLLLSFGYSNAVWAITAASLIILAAGLPISYYASRYNIDIDLLTRSAGFGYVGSTITSLIYASFCFIFFALEAAIMAQALKLYFELPLYLGYILCSLIIIPIVFYGVTLINRLHQWTQPLWLILMLTPFYFVITREPTAIEFMSTYEGSVSGSNTFDPYYFGIATGISFSLIAQIGEQVDYLRFMPDKHKGNRISWWFSMLAGGPGWIVLGFLKQVGGMLLAALVVLSGLAIAEAKEPVQMYYTAYTYVFSHPGLALTVSTIFVVISQIKINVTNAYAGSLAWSNFFSRVTYSHPGRVVWLVFNIGIALLLMELGVFNVIQKVLGLYSNVAIAWIAAVVADLTINKPFKLSPPLVEFKRAHLYNYNPVGFVSMSVASVVSIFAFTGAFGLYAQAYSWLIALVISLVLVPIIAILTKGKYYIARENLHFGNSDHLSSCGVCGQQYAEMDMAYCPYHETPICSLCCTLESLCRDQCKPRRVSFFNRAITGALILISKGHLSNRAGSRVASLLLSLGVMLGVVAATLWLAYSISSDTVNSEIAAEIRSVLYNLFFALAALISMAAWWMVLLKESQALAESELSAQNEILERQITARKQAEEEIRSLAFYDVLTKLPNRRLLLDRLGLSLAASARSQKFGALLFLDMDKFKTLNDTLGHDYGDLLLIEVAQRILCCVRQTDTVARFGGDEFVLLFEDIGGHAEEASQTVALIAEKVRVSLAAPYQLKEHEYLSSPSIGVCLFSGNEESADTLLKRADMAMYQAKDSGRNVVRFFDPAMQHAVETRAQLEGDLRSAVREGQLRLFYQIQVDTELRPLGAEALVRWIHPTHGMVLPAQFIPLSEESSLIFGVGQWVLETACRQLALWGKREQTCNLELAINVSAQQFRLHGFVDTVAAMVRIHQVNPARLKLELTESVVLTDVADIVKKMHALKALGIKLSMDDFGTGYSSLSYLKQLPLDQLKIDQSFVRDIVTDPNDAVMVQTIIDLAQNFRLNVIAEGVESESQLDFLKQNDCKAYQGYLFSKPVPIDEFEALLK